MSYTKGPWKIRETIRGDFDIDTSSAEPRLGYIGWEGLATFYGSKNNRRAGLAVARANATLAAAAPELLEALQKLERYFVSGNCIPIERAVITRDSFEEIARAAIEKATKP